MYKNKEEQKKQNNRNNGTPSLRQDDKVHSFSHNTMTKKVMVAADHFELKRIESIATVL